MPASPCSDDGLLRGDGAFEFVRCYLGKPFTLGEHLDRPAALVCTHQASTARADTVEAEIAAPHGGHGAAQPRSACGTHARRAPHLLTEPYVDHARRGWLFVADQPRPLLVGAKSLSYAANMLAKRIAAERGLEEALLTTPDGLVMEVQQAAFFWVDAEGVLCTPPLSEGILDSITRRVVMRHLAVEEHACGTHEALAAREAFLAGSAREIHPVGIIESRVFTEVPGPITRRAIEAYWDEVQEGPWASRAHRWRQRLLSAAPAAAQRRSALQKPAAGRSFARGRRAAFVRA